MNHFFAGCVEVYADSIVASNTDDILIIFRCVFIRCIIILGDDGIIAIYREQNMNINYVSLAHVTHTFPKHSQYESK